MYLRFCLSILLAVIVSMPSMASRVYSFTSIGNERGLTSNCVKCILQDSYDFMWFGTKNGLNRYDGRKLRHFNCYDNESHRGNNNIGALYEDAEHVLWVGTDRGIYKYDPHSERFTYIDAKSNDGVSADDWVQDIKGDANGNIWVLVPNQGLFRYYNGGVDHHNVTTDPSLKNCTVASITVTQDGEIYIGTTNEGLFRYDSMLKTFRPVSNGSPIFSRLREKTIQVSAEIGRDKLLLLTQDGEIYRLNTKTLDIQPVDFSGAGKIFLRAAQMFDDEVWIGTQNGLYILNLTDRSEQYISGQTANANGLTDNLIYSIYNDSRHNVWIGTMFGGVCFYQRDGFSFERFLATGHPHSLRSNRLRGMATGPDGNIYIGTEDAGVSVFDPRTGETGILRPMASDLSPSLMTRCYDGKVFFGLSRDGLQVYDPATGVHSIIADDLVGNPSSSYSVLVDATGDMWVGADWGLFHRRRGESTFTKVDEVGDTWVFDILQDRNGRIWLAGMGDGVWIIDQVKNEFKHYPYDEAHSNGLRSNSVSSLTEDSKGNIWVSTDRGGLSRYNPETDCFDTYDIENGLPDNVVYDVLEDSRGYLWFGTNKGLVKFNPETGAVKVFTTSDGLAGNQFNYHAATVGSDGMFYFGGIDGLIAFNPELDCEPSSLAPIYFTNLKIGNADITALSAQTVSEQSLMFTDKIEIPNDAHHITISVASPAYGNTGGVTYSYRMLPTSDEWITLDDSRNISFATISPGTYTLEVRASGETAEVDRALTIYVPSPWYRTKTASVSYVLIVLMSMYVFWFQWKKRRETKLIEREYMFKMQTEKELYENKVQFFSEVAHEIRTPLTLIQTPLEAIEEIGVKDARVERYLSVMRKNTLRLLDLVSQLLDFQKIGNSRKKLNFEYVNVSSLVNDIASRFRDAIDIRNKHLILNLPDAAVQAMIDKEAVTKIVSNLLSNAMKYATSEIVATLTANENSFTLSVVSDGKKIEGEDVYSIFTPFYQIHTDAKVEGVGIGLPLSRMLASLHNGSLELVIDDKPTNNFELTLPLIQEGVESPLTSFNPVLTDYVMDEEPQAANAPAGNSLLLVEDNPEMRDFLNEQLSRYFVIETAENGKVALEKLADNNFDIIVTDIMMPEMDGYEFCRAVKSDVEHSHIPVVFLTAKNDLESKVNALKCGGEAYIEKPFSIKYFREQVKSLLENRRHERRSLVKKPFFTVDNMKLSKADEEFMNKVVQTIQENISDENFNVETMADVMCMSRSSLLRKIKALFNLSPLELIRLVRLKKAAELIKEGKYRIGDICFMVGINSSSYFSKLFLKQFGITPKAFEMQCQKNARTSTLQDNGSDEDE